jgi:hypothetical protein
MQNPAGKEGPELWQSVSTKLPGETVYYSSHLFYRRVQRHDDEGVYMVLHRQPLAATGWAPGHR